MDKSEEYRQGSLFGIFKNLFQTFFRTVKHFKMLAILEAQLAGKSLAMIIGLSFLVGSLLTTTWLCLLALAIIGLMYLNLGLLLSLAIVTITNIVLLLSILLFMLKLKKNLSFPATRRQFSFSKNKELPSERLAKKN